MFNNLLDRKETLFGHKNFTLSKSQTSHFSKGLTHALVKNCNFFLYLFSVKLRLEIMFKNVLDRKEPFFGHKKFSLSKSQK